MDDRSERLRKRRKQSSDPSNHDGNRSPSNPSKPAKPSEPAEPSERSETDVGTGDGGRSASGSIKEKQTGTYMYLPESQTKELRRRYNVLKAEYEFQYDDEFEKNRHFYPLVIRFGLDRLEGMDVTEIRQKLEEHFD